MRTNTRILLTILLALALAGVGSAYAKGERGDDREERDDRDDDRGRDGHRGHGARAHRDHEKIVLQNDNVTIRFHGAKPDLRIVFNGSEDDERAGYRVKLLRLYEAPNGTTDHRGHMPRFNLAKSDDWNVDIVETNTSVVLTMVRAERQGIVTIVWHLDTVNATVKYDLRVDNWRWANASNRLVLDTLVVGRNLKNATGANVSVEDSGYISWATTASATYAPNDTRTIPVSSVVKPSKEERDDDGAESGAHILLVFNGTGGYKTLDYDPVFGVQSSGARVVPVPAAPLVVAAVALVALGLAGVSRLKRR